MPSGGRRTRELRASFFLGAAFLAIQGVEWARLVANGLSTRDDVYGGLFVVIGGPTRRTCSAGWWCSAW